MPKKGLKTPFQRGHEAQFGLFATERDEATSAVLLLEFGREAKPRAKLKLKSHSQSFTAPFRVDVYNRHHENAHPERWAEFQQLSTDEKSNYFENAINHASTLLAHFDSHGSLTLTFNRDIVDKVIGDLLFDVDDESIHFTHERALFVFKLHEEALPEDNADVYSVKIESVLRFKMISGFVSKVASFRSASKFVDVAREVTNLSYLQGCSEGVCATYIRIICAASLQDIHDILRRCWAYSIALDVGHAQGTSYMDVRIRFGASAGMLVNVHVIALPLHTKKTTETQFNTTSKALDAIDSSGLSMIVSIGTDGERTMTGRLSGVQTRFEQAETFPLVRVWFGLHQVDLVAQKEYIFLADDTFVKTLTGLIAYLRRKQNLTAEMKTTCPKFVSSRWFSMKRVTEWLIKHRVRVSEYLEGKKPACNPPVGWWIILLCLDSVATVLARTCSLLQGLSTLLSQKQADFT
ncbi:hypothetical protein PsorP6_009055 [Peronosclerospora sorghi]|uniref:Uncharacterized protein n=1 Tax=Peronosclerospora sorghi TaxID=230839 RepID=A0ACC0VYX2_9STRA|nr:hypothetical protein PsorP6_009055 [Peronosclerospora sorghi]